MRTEDESPLVACLDLDLHIDAAMRQGVKWQKGEFRREFGHCQFFGITGGMGITRGGTAASVVHASSPCRVEYLYHSGGQGLTSGRDLAECQVGPNERGLRRSLGEKYK